jgi:glycosyltransferase involved in cell wall biosynthesis
MSSSRRCVVAGAPSRSPSCPTAKAPEATLQIAGDGDLPEHPALADPRVAVRHEHVPEPEVAGLFARSTCVVLPYREASQSGVGSQAKQHGRGMVVTGVGGLPELVADGSGLVVAPGDAHALGAALSRVATEPDLAAALGEAAEAGAAAGGWRTVAERTLSAYERFGLLAPG